jgi:hypothetical protein
MRCLAVALITMLFIALPASPALAQSAPCQYILGFATLHALDATDTGDCLDNQAFAANGDAQQHTTKGLMAWRKADNWTAFTNGYWTWINGPDGLVKRLNTERFAWEANPDGLPLAGAPARLGPPDAYPPASSPGAIDPTVTQANIATTICVSGYTATVRPPVSYTDPLKAQQIAALGLPGGLADYEEDHVVPLEVGGAPSDPRNLTPEHYAEPYGAHDKDKVENYLHDQVCSGAMTLAAAQQAIEQDWVAVYRRIVPAAGSPTAPTGQHTYYASSYRTADTIYCDTDPGWKGLSAQYLESYPTLAAARAANPGYTLHQAC